MKKLKSILLLLLLLSSLNAKELQKVSLQLHWLDQFQFAGYYVAKEKGFYEDVGLDVEIKKFNQNIKPIEEVTSLRATYGVGRSFLVMQKSNGAKINLLASIFQSSPSIILARKDSNIKTINDFIGKRIMLTQDVSLSISLFALENKFKIEKKQLIELEHSFNIDDLINKKTDLMAAYISNEPFLMKEKGIGYTIFNPASYGFDIYSDILFTSTQESLNHKQRALNFKQASLKGWEYAFSHIGETVRLIQKKYNIQNKSEKALIYEANELKKLAYYNVEKIGKINKHKIQRIYDIYNLLGQVDNEIDIGEFILQKDISNEVILSKKEKQYLLNKKTIKICTPIDIAPFVIKKTGGYEGIIVDFLDLISKEAKFEYELISTDTVDEHFDLVKDSTCDMVGLVATDTNTKEYIIPTKSIVEDDIVLVTKINEPYLYDLENLADKKIAIKRGQGGLIKYVKYHYPNLNLVYVDEDGLEKVNDGTYYGYISVSYYLGHEIATNYFYNLKIMAKIGKDKIRGSFGISKQEPILSSIFDKYILNISKKQKREIVNKWVYLNYTPPIDYTYIKTFLIIISLILLIVIIFLIKQNSLKKRIEELNKSLEYKVEQSTKDLKIAQNMAKLGSWRYEGYSNKLTWSDETYNIFGVQKGKAELSIEKDFYDLIYSEDIDKVREAYAKHLQTQENYVVTHRILDKNNNIKYLEERCESIFDINGDLLVSTGTVQDITEQKLQNKYIIRQSRLAQMGEMISMIAHQWRQPLGAISAISIDMKMQLELDTYDFSKKDEKELFLAYFDKSFTSIDRLIQGLTETITDFKDFYKPNKEKKIAKVDLSIANALDILKTPLLSNNIMIVKHFVYDKDIEIYTNEMTQVILNIINNALDNFIEKDIKNPKISIVTTAIDNGVQIEILDNGGGIDSELIDNVFDPYFSTKNEKNGTGLGLYMSKLIIEEHHSGEIDVENHYDTNGKRVGTNFTIKLNEKISI